MNFWQGFGIFVLGCFVGAFVMIFVLSLRNIAASADRHIERAALERYEREAKEDSKRS